MHTYTSIYAYTYIYIYIHTHTSHIYYYIYTVYIHVYMYTYMFGSCFIGIVLVTLSLTFATIKTACLDESRQQPYPKTRPRLPCVCVFLSLLPPG